MKPIVLVVDAYGRDAPYPFLTHTFRGPSIEAVQQAYESHLQYDAMLQSCTLLRHFLDFDCWTIARWDTNPTEVSS